MPTKQEPQMRNESTEPVFPRLPELHPDLSPKVVALGKVLGEFGPSPALPLFMSASVLLTLVGTFVLLVVLIDISASATARAIRWWVFVGVLLIVAGIGFVVRGWSGLGRRVFVFEKGLLDVKGPRVEVYHWEDVASIVPWESAGYLEALVYGPFRVTIQRKDTKKLVLNTSTQDVRKLADWLQRELIRFRFPDETKDDDQSPPGIG
jgi:Family of unknown function (DUF6585)